MGTPLRFGPVVSISMARYTSVTLNGTTTSEFETTLHGWTMFGVGGTYDQLTARALASGFVECPLEVGPYLRLQFLDQAEGSVGFPATKHRAPPGSITVASVPLDDRDETPKGFYLRRIDGVLWLRGYWSHPDNAWRPDDVLIYGREGGALREEASGGPGAV